jgi:Polyketide cyclase / dehydrase and lipid transport
MGEKLAGNSLLSAKPAVVIRYPGEMADSPSTFVVERSTTIAATPEKIFPLLQDFHRWVDWSPWEGIDPNLQRTYTGPASGVGASYAWVGSRKVGSGRMEIVAASPADSLDIELAFLKPFKAENHTRFQLQWSGATTIVTWTMSGKKSLVSKIMGIFMSMDKLIGKDFEKGLAQLRTLAER